MNYDGAAEMPLVMAKLREIGSFIVNRTLRTKSDDLRAERAAIDSDLPSGNDGDQPHFRALRNQPWTEECQSHLPLPGGPMDARGRWRRAARAEGKIHRVDPEFGSTLTVSNRDSQSNRWVNWKVMGQPCEFQVHGDGDVVRWAAALLADHPALVGVPDENEE
jgi:hypothetical protein